MTIISEYNQRQLNLLKKFIDDYEKGNITLPLLISNIEGLLTALENFPPKQHNELVSKWGVLEEIHSICLDENNRPLNLYEKDTIDQVLLELQKLCSSLIRR
ncbi:MAG: hypothetical protein EBU46_14950 [Nitrosomonadaceae bacterium]|nr:hypothetical protein [Nitrosomonadaceae bacterium]